MSRLDQVRGRRMRRVRTRLEDSSRYRMTVHRTERHVYAQVLSPDGAQVIAQASTLSPELRKKIKTTGNCEAAGQVGRMVAERALKAKVEEVWFDRGRFRYHGRVRALAEAAREAGLKF